MKSILLLAALFSTSAFANTTRSQIKVKTPAVQAELPSDVQAEGLRVNYSRSQYDIKIEIGGGMKVEGDSSRSMSYVNKIGVGYAYLPIGSLGFIGDFNYMELNVQSHSNDLVRPEVNAAYAFNRYVNVHGGINVSRIVGPGASDFDTGHGFQIGVGGQLNRTFGGELNYVESKLDLSQLPAASFDFKGLDFNLVATF